MSRFAKTRYALLSATFATFSACGSSNEDGRAAQRLIERAGCGSCHRIAGINSAQGQVGPPLLDFHRRAYIAGVVPNEFGILVEWLVDPASISPETAMPSTGLNQQEAEQIAHYLYDTSP